jgi:N-acetylmuramoyl-L-alanine amidase
LLAEAVAEGLSDTIGKIPGGVDLIQYMFIPQQVTAITVECKLISHGRYEPKMLLDVEFLRLIAAGIAWGVDKYTVLPHDKIEP